MRAYFFVAIMFIIILHGNSVYALKENNLVEFVFEGKIIPLKEETKQSIVSTLESLLPTCTRDSITNADTWQSLRSQEKGGIGFSRATIFVSFLISRLLLGERRKHLRLQKCF